MNLSERVICTVAEPTRGLFPLPPISQALRESLQHIDNEVPDCFEREREDALHTNHHPPGAMREHFITIRLNEIERNKVCFGDAPTIELEGVNHDGIRLRYLIGEKLIVITVRQTISPDEEDRARRAIPQLKHIIAGIYPELSFEDVTA